MRIRDDVDLHNLIKNGGDARAVYEYMRDQLEEVQDRCGRHEVEIDRLECLLWKKGIHADEE